MDFQGYSEVDFLNDFNNASEKAFTEIHNRYYSELIVFSMQLVKNKFIAEETVQDSFIKVFKKHKDFSSLPNLRSFLYVTTRNGCLDYLRSERRKDNNIKILFEYLESDPKVEIPQIQGEVLHEIYSAIKQLPEKSKIVIEKLYADGLEPKHVSEQLEMSLSSVYSHKQYALHLLKSKLEKVLIFAFLLGSCFK